MKQYEPTNAPPMATSWSRWRHAPTRLIPSVGPVRAASPPIALMRSCLFKVRDQGSRRVRHGSDLRVTALPQRSHMGADEHAVVVTTMVTNCP